METHWKCLLHTKQRLLMNWWCVIIWPKVSLASWRSQERKVKKKLTCYTFLCRNIWSSYLRIRLLMNLVCVIILIKVQECKLKVIVNYQYHQKCSVHVVKRAVNHIVFCPIWKLTIDRITPHCESCFFLFHGSCARFNQDSARWLEIM